jgi:hypothetical protein
MRNVVDLEAEFVDTSSRSAVNQVSLTWTASLPNGP